eukprot:gb/GECG01011617.1/.p1 GENE.gb/GECG01011617.1/~~gb/GECG01011617.1/.p1  ORF type:complete len:371 (+),score=58.75 gb/GECG01011617.1/:1-1113(+)
MRTRREGKRSPKKGDTDVETAKNAIKTASSAGAKGKARATRGRAATKAAAATAANGSPKQAQKKKSPSKGATSKKATETKASPAEKKARTAKRATTPKKAAAAAADTKPARTKRVPKKTRRQMEADADAAEAQTGAAAAAVTPAKTRKTATKRKAHAEATPPTTKKAKAAKATKPKAAPARQAQAPPQAAAAIAAPPRQPNMDYVYLKCVKIGSKLRVRIITQGYNLHANCQFPRAIRAEGKTFRVPTTVVRVAEGAAGKFFYRIPAGSVVEVTAAEAANAPVPRMRPPEAQRVAVARPKPAASAAAPVKNPTKIFTIEECTICMDNESDMVFVPCGHMCVCRGCVQSITDKCVMCRTTIARKIHKSEMD